MNSVLMFLEDNIRFIFLYASKISVFGGVQVLGKTKAKKKRKKLPTAWKCLPEKLVSVLMVLNRFPGINSPPHTPQL